MGNFVLRLPDGLHEEIREMATREERSLNSQIQYLLTRAARAAPGKSGTAGGILARSHVEPGTDEDPWWIVSVTDADDNEIVDDAFSSDWALDTARDATLADLGYVRTGPWENDDSGVTAPVRHISNL